MCVEKYSFKGFIHLYKQTKCYRCFFLAAEDFIKSILNSVTCFRIIDPGELDAGRQQQRSLPAPALLLASQLPMQEVETLSNATPVQSHICLQSTQNSQISNNIKTAAHNNETLLKAFTFIFILKPMKPPSQDTPLAHRTGPDCGVI